MGTETIEKGPGRGHSERTSACKHCGSSSQQRLNGETATSFPGIKNVNEPPVYVCQQILVCLDCGFTELLIPVPELERIREGAKRSAHKVAYRHFPSNPGCW
jgi:hypothetical protein